MEAKIAEETRELIEDLRKKSSDLVFMHNAFDVGVLNVLWTMMAGERFTLDDVRLIKLLQIVHDAFRLFDMSGGLLNQLPVLRFLAPGCCGYTKTVEILKRMWLFLEVSPSGVVARFSSAPISGDHRRASQDRLLVALARSHRRVPAGDADHFRFRFGVYRYASSFFFWAR
uniref:Uncharacterized protein n=1 Tax=Photinus pyralis TaxID=7054 RepID=A0A1Y1ND80_PHOPY